MTVTLAGIWKTPPPESWRKVSMSSEYISVPQSSAAYM